MIQSTKAFSQNLNGSSLTTPLSSEVQEEQENDVEMNGAVQNGSHSEITDGLIDIGTKDGSINEMGNKT